MAFYLHYIPNVREVVSYFLNLYKSIEMYWLQYVYYQIDNIQVKLDK